MSIKNDLCNLTPVDCKIILYAVLHNNQIVINKNGLSSLLKISRPAISKSIDSLIDLKILECYNKDLNIFNVKDIAIKDNISTEQIYGINEVYKNVNDIYTQNKEGINESYKNVNEVYKNVNEVSESSRCKLPSEQKSEVGTKSANHKNHIYKNHKDKSKNDTKIYDVNDFFNGLYDLKELDEALIARAQGGFSHKVDKINTKNKTIKEYIERTKPYWDSKLQKELINMAAIALVDKSNPSAYFISCLKNKLTELENKPMKKLESQTERSLNVLNDAKKSTDKEMVEVKKAITAYKKSNPDDYNSIKNDCDPEVLSLMDYMTGSEYEKRKTAMYKKLMSSFIYKKIKK